MHGITQQEHHICDGMQRGRLDDHGRDGGVELCGLVHRDGVTDEFSHGEKRVDDTAGGKDAEGYGNGPEG